MNEQNIKNRKKWVRGIAVVFFLALLLLTFFSNTIMNRSLPKVVTKQIQSGSIALGVSGSGMIEAGSEKSITLNQSRVVDKVMVKAGDEVKKGDVLITLKAGDSEEIKQAEQELIMAQNTYNKQKLVGEATDDIIRQAESGGLIYETARNRLANLSANVKSAKENLDAISEEAENLAAEAAKRQSQMQSQMQAGLPNDGSENGNPEEQGVVTSEMSDVSNTVSDTADAEQSALEEIEKRKTDAQKQYDSAVEEHDKYMAEINFIDELKTGYEAVVSAREKLDKVKSETIGNEIKSECDGIVQTVMTEDGKTAMQGEQLMSISDSSSGYSMKISVTQKESKNVAVGDKAEITDFYVENVEVSVSAIQMDAENPKLRQIVFEVKGDVAPGSFLSVRVGSKRENHDMVVPNSAVHIDNDGSFIYVVESKSSPLGNRYYARKKNVEILATDLQNTAISGDVANDDYVIITSNKLVETNHMVKMEEE